MITAENKHIQCPCPECVARRRAMIMTHHPLHNDKSDPGPTMIPIPQALAMALEERDDLRERLATVEQQIKSLRDCA